MAGKSTILRSTCAVAVLAACGLYAPIQKAVVPYTDAFMLRTFSADIPTGDMSSFRVEMSEMRCSALTLFTVQIEWPVAGIVERLRIGAQL